MHRCMQTSSGNHTATYKFCSYQNFPLYESHVVSILSCISYMYCVCLQEEAKYHDRLITLFAKLD